MRRVLLIWLLVCAPGFWLLAAPDPEEQLIVDTAYKWLALTDAGQYEAAWNAWPARITSGGLGKNWAGWMQARRSPLGNVKSRELVKITHQSKLRGAPDGDYSIVEFETSFERKRNSVENVTLTRENGYWQVSGYHFH